MSYARVQTCKLTDGSKVHNVLLDNNDGEEKCLIALDSEKAAHNLAMDINKHSVNIEFY